MAKKMRFFSIFEKKDMKKEIIYVKAPLNSTEWMIDDFLGNSFQYKLDGEWHYDTSVQLPNCDQLIVIGESNKTNTHKIIALEIVN